MAQQHPHRTVLCDLPDSCLLQVFKHLCPLPDKFSVGACCWRFYRLVSDRRLWLVVTPTGRAPESAPGGAGPVYTTLAAAVQASRPGDTIWLAPGATHTAADVDIPWPLHILGGGHHPSDTWLSAPRDADCALCFTSSAKMAQLSVATTLCPCVIHKRGSLTIQNCVLASEPKGLQHLVSPVLTLAVSTAAAAAVGGGGIPAAAAALGMSNMALEDLTNKQPAAAALPSSTPVAGSSSSSGGCGGRDAVMICKPPACIGPGKLQVVECQLMGGSTAVRCGGTGRLRNVRAIYESRSKAPYFWLEVDSSDRPAVVLAEISAAAAAAAPMTAVLTGNAAGVGESLWAGAGAFPQQHKQELAAAAAVDIDSGSDASILLQHRSKAWQQRQRQAGGGGPGCPNVGLARIQAVLGGRSINPSSLAAHLTSKQQQQEQE